ncbi:MAG: cell wall hydrolase [Novosphingobium sp.]
MNTPAAITATFISQPVVQPVATATPEAAIEADAAVAASLAELVEETQVPSALSNELECLAGAVYFEAKSETLAGQLAVGRVIVARANSGRFPSSYCGVVYQPSQFSFVRGHGMPAINRDSRAWQTAVRIARIADEGLWKSPVEGAMFFHAAHVSPRWGKTRMARVDSHIFYR